MKKIIFIVIFAIITNAILFGERKFTLQTSPSTLFAPLTSLAAATPYDNTFVLPIDLEIQYMINDRFNLSLKPMLYYFSYDEASTFLKIIEINFKPMLIFRPFKTGLKGYYIGLYQYTCFNSIEDEDDNISFTLIGVGIDTGYKWIFKSGFTLQFGCGFGKSWFLQKVSYDVFMTADPRIIIDNFMDFSIDIKIGYSF